MSNKNKKRFGIWCDFQSAFLNCPDQVLFDRLLFNQLLFCQLPDREPVSKPF